MAFIILAAHWRRVSRWPGKLSSSFTAVDTSTAICYLTPLTRYQRVANTTTKIGGFLVFA